MLIAIPFFDFARNIYNSNGYDIYDSFDLTVDNYLWKLIVPHIMWGFLDSLLKLLFTSFSSLIIFVICRFFYF
jgi:hypothetical protein